MGIHVNEEIIEEIRRRNDIIDIVSRYVPLTKSGRNYKGLCPFHHEKTPSFMVSDEKQLYHCFGCGEAGNVIHFVMKMENLDFIDAVTLMGQWVGIHVEEISSNKQEKEELSRKNKIYEINREAALFYYKNLLKKNSPGLAYLKQRGLEESVIRRFGLGYAENHWETLNTYLIRKGYDQEFICSAGLVLEKKTKDGFYDRFRNRVIFPIINTTGNVVGFGGRALDDSLPKYLNSPETSVFHKGNNLFGLNLAKKEIGKDRKIIVVEGYMDVISLYQHGIRNVVASLGTALTKPQGEMLKRYSDEIIIAYDADAAGQKATLRGLDILNELGCKVKVIRLTEAKDPDEFVRRKGKDAFLEEVERALPFLDYKIILAKMENDVRTTEGRIQFVKAVAALLKQIKSPVEVDAYIKKIALESQISEEAIKREIFGNHMYDPSRQLQKPFFNRDKYRSKADRHTNKYSVQSVKPIQKQGYVEAERSLLKLILQDKEIFSKIKTIIPYSDFTDSVHQKIAKMIYGCYEMHGKISMEMLLNDLDIEEVKILGDIRQIVVPEENVEKALMDFIHTMHNHKLEEEKKRIERELENLEKKDSKTQEEMVRIRELCGNLEKILKELKRL
ncbi:DNA primase [Thermotalea metallivorans]|uniref:DNA primase n=1 Tax=Thermotalea metallivorans TaxID=520762 RepID=A0A140L5R7_9FIRM|nr:DNA primase [Thermotalea metallivorans]KXG75892.1 DNA primase [Thermotalea metallivorans]